VFASITLLAGVDGQDNNFGELIPASLAGYVYEDANNDGIFQITETGIVGATVTLTGTDDLGQAVNVNTTTVAGGGYAFDNLRPGTYTINESQPSGYLDGKDTQGTPGTGTAGNDVFASIALAAGVDGQDNNFGELIPASLAGYVYEDANNDGIFQITETGIVGATVTLTGTDDLGQAVSVNGTTVAGGGYAFDNLRPGTYTINESQPSGIWTARTRRARRARARRATTCLRRSPWRPASMARTTTSANSSRRAWQATCTRTPTTTECSRSLRRALSGPR